MNGLLYTAAGTATLFFLWVFFLAVMCLQAARDAGTITPWGLRFGYIVLGIGYVLDLAGQVVCTLFIFCDVPRELTVSQHVKRLIATGSGWRKARAEWFRDHLLKPFDRTGRHG